MKSQDIGQLAVKSLDVRMVGFLYVILGSIISSSTDYLFGRFVEKVANQISNFRLAFLIFTHIAIILLAVYFIKYAVSIIPFPFDGYFGYDHLNTKKLETGSFILSFVVYLYHPQLRARLIYFSNRIRHTLGIRPMVTTS